MAGNHLLVPSGEMALGKMNDIGELKYLAQKIGPRSEALNDSGHLFSAGSCAPGVIRGSSVAGSLGVFDDTNLRRGFCFLLFSAHHSCSFRNLGGRHSVIVIAHASAGAEQQVRGNACENNCSAEASLHRAVPRQQD